ncbi:MAG: MFS transporter [Akkermansiaceae bacterium]|nr:MFS transporter [Akkermansiaceae bacterium]
MIEPAPPPPATRSRTELRRGMTLISIGLIATTLGTVTSIGELPLTNVLMNQLGCNAEQVSRFFWLMTIPWAFKPLAGLLSDSIPLCGTRRRHYILFASAIAAGLWFVLAWVTASYVIMLGAAMLLYASFMLVSTVIGALIVEEGRRNAATGRLTSLRSAIVNISYLVGGPLSGLLATRYGPTGGLRLAAGVGALTFLALWITSYFFLREKRIPGVPVGQTVRNAGRNITGLFKHPTLWVAVGFISLVLAIPSFATLMTFKQRNELGFSFEQIGYLRLVFGIFGLLGAIIFRFMCGRLSLRWTLTVGLVIFSLSNMAYFFYNSMPAAFCIEAINGLVITLIQAPLFDLAARSTPKGSEALGYGLIMAVWSNVQQFAPWFGAALNQHFHITLGGLIWINVVVAMSLVTLIPLMPRSVMNRREGEH